MEDTFINNDCYTVGSAQADNSQRYWELVLENAPNHIDFNFEPSHHAENKVYQLETHCFSIGERQCHELENIGFRLNSSISTVLYAVFVTLLHRYTDQHEFVTGYCLDTLIGDSEYLPGADSILPIRVNISGNPPFNEMLGQIEKAVDGAVLNRNVPVSVLQALFSKGEANRSFSQVFFSFAEKSVPQAGSSSLIKDSYHKKFETPDADLIFCIQPVGSKLEGQIQYNTGVFNQDAISSMVLHFNNLLDGIIQNQLQPIRTLPILSKSEQDKIISEWNNTRAPFPNKCLPELFEEQVKKTPDAIAVELFTIEETVLSPTANLSYRLLNEKANQLAHYLRGQGVGPDVLVGIFMTRSLDMAIVVLGILKAGGAYLPLDTAYPNARLNYMLNDSGISFLISEGRLADKLDLSDINVTCLDKDQHKIADNLRDNPVTNITPCNLAYVIYTSGSTGMPKGTLIEHKGVVNYLTWCIKTYKVADGIGCPVSSSLGFDATVTSFLSPLFTGRKVLLLPEQGEIEALCTILTKNRDLSLIKITPAHLEILSGLLSESEVSEMVNTIVIGGEALTRKGLGIWLNGAPGTRLINEYGPTETVVGCSYFEVEPATIASENIPIGRPIANTRLYILDEYLQPVPVGVAGELYISGAGLARGYHNRPELTAERFVANPWGEEENERMYKTGDLAHYLADGTIVFLGRCDHQVKIRGYRIELGEIESVLCQFPEIQQAAVIVKEHPSGDKAIVAYVVSNDQEKYNPEKIKYLLGEKLPAYMIPSTIVLLKKIPLTTNGKVNRSVLLVANQLKTEREIIAPGNDLEIELVKFLEKTLGLNPVGIRDNFFDLGINSLQAYRMFSKIKSLTGVQLPLSILFQYPTIEQLEGYLKERKANAPWTSLVPIQPNGNRLPLYLIHAGGGTVLFYRKLSQFLGQDQPVFGLQPQGLDGKRKFHKNIEEMAAHYIKEIRAANPTGPYLLGGYCFGGVIAFEMAQQLVSQGYQVDLLANFNAVSPTYQDRSGFVMRNLDNKMPAQPDQKIKMYPRFTLKNFAAKSFADKVDYLNGKIKSRLVRPIKKKLVVLRFYAFYAYLFLLVSLYKCLRLLSINPPEAIRKYYFVVTNSQMVKTYKPKLYTGSLTVFRSPMIYKDPHLGWTEFVEGEIQTYDISGDHKNNRQIMNEPFVEETANALKTHIEKKMRKVN